MKEEMEDPEMEGEASWWQHLGEDKKKRL